MVLKSFQLMQIMLKLWLLHWANNLNVNTFVYKVKMNDDCRPKCLLGLTSRNSYLNFHLIVLVWGKLFHQLLQVDNSLRGSLEIQRCLEASSICWPWRSSNPKVKAMEVTAKQLPCLSEQVVPQPFKIQGTIFQPKFRVQEIQMKLASSLARPSRG